MRKWFRRQKYPRKKGFTMIELVVSIAIITLVGATTTLIIINNNKNKEIKTLKNNSTKLYEALQVYLETNKDVINNVNKNAKGAIITLETLKNEGLIKNDLNVDYKKKYYLITNAVMAPSNEQINCEKDQVELSIVESWNVDTDKVIYICSNNNTYDDSSLQDTISSLQQTIIEMQDKLSSYEITQNNKTTTFTGNNANNYVKFPVITGNNENNLLYFGEGNDKDLWRLYSYKGIDGSPSSMKLIYNTNVKVKDRLSVINWQRSSDRLVVETDSSNCDFFQSYNGRKKYYKILRNDIYEVDGSACYERESNVSGYYYYKVNNEIYKGHSGMDYKIWYNGIDYYKATKLTSFDASTVYCKIRTGSSNKYKYKSKDGITSEELEDDNNFTSLYNKIEYKDWIADNSNYYINYNSYSAYNISLDLTNKVQRKVGIISSAEIISTKANNSSWLLDIMKNRILGKTEYDLKKGITFVDENFSLVKTLSDDCDKGKCDGGALEYVPVVTLKQGVKFIKDPNCSQTSTPGSKNCPYLLNYNGINT